jgi:uncharacterized membrane protein
MRPGALWIALGLSLAANAFLAAFATALFVSPRLAPPAAGAGALRIAARQLDDGHRAAFMALLRADGRRLRPQTRAARTLRRQAWASLEAPIFDPAAAKAQLAAGRTLNVHARAAVEDDVIDFAAGLPADQREALGRALYRLTPPPGATQISRPTPDPASPAPDSSPGTQSPG